ncbi:MAG: hypothetical protein KF708_06295 [Pirellulales bacterium]|nr:hypothetical protein [Pirellulales bacterium]
MNELLGSSLLWARIGWFEQLTRQVGGGGSRWNATHFVLLTLAVAGLAALALWARQVRAGSGRQQNNPRALFRALCRAHGLDHASRRLLDQLARQQRLADPARLFLEPERFEAASLGPALKSQQGRYASLRDRLFAEPGVVSRETTNERRRPSSGTTSRAGL